jgi:hypothetical protein
MNLPEDDVMNVPQWLTDHGFAEYAAVFAANAIDGDVFAELTDQDLRELGVEPLGVRKKLLAAVAALKQSRQEQHGDARSDAMRRLLQRMPCPIAIPLSEYIDERHSLAKLWAACDTIEMMLRLITIAGIAKKVADGGFSDALRIQLTDSIEMPTLGKWFSMARVLSSKQMPDAAGFVERPLRALLYGSNNPGTPDTSFITLRNRLAHGGGLLRSEAARLMAAWCTPFEAVIASAQFLQKWQLIGRDSAGSWILLAGKNPTPMPAAFPFPEDDTPDAVWLNNSEQSLRLWPLALYGRPRTQEQVVASDTTQIYTRREPMRLVYTPIGSMGFGQSESDAKAVKAFEEVFRLADRRAIRSFQIAAFQDEIHKDAAELVGRQKEIETVLQALQESEEGVWWLSGSYGVGKSFLMARLAVELQEAAAKDVLVFAYRFRAGDQTRCSRDAFAQYLVERVESAGALIDSHKDKSGDKAEKRLAALLSALKPDFRVVVLLDGIDEVARRDPSFVEDIPLGLRFPRIRWLCAGRPEAPVADAMRRMKAQELFAEGLSPMQANDIRAMILEKIGRLRKVLLRHDRENSEVVENPFIDLVTHRAAGLPLYVKYVIGDILSGKYRVLDGDEQLPPSLLAYHERLLAQNAIGDLQSLRTQLIAMLACAAEPLTVAALAELLAYRTQAFSDDWPDLVSRAVAAVEGMTRTTVTPDDEVGFSLSHQSLRDYILTSSLMKHAVVAARETFADLALNPRAPDLLKHYRVRCGVQHLLDAGREDEARHMLLDLEVVADMQRLGVYWSDFYSWWTTLGGEAAATGYVDSTESLTTVIDEAVCRQLEALVDWLHKSCWYGLAAQVEPHLLRPSEELCRHYSGLTALLRLAECRYETERPEELKAIILAGNLHAVEGYTESSEASWMLDWAYWHTGERSKCSESFRLLATMEWTEQERADGAAGQANEIWGALFGEGDHEKTKQLILRATKDQDNSRAFRDKLLKELMEAAAYHGQEIGDICRWVRDYC